MKSKRILGVTWFPNMRYNRELWLLLISSAGAHPKNDAKEMPLYGDIKVRSAVKTIFGCVMNKSLISMQIRMDRF